MPKPLPRSMGLALVLRRASAGVAALGAGLIVAGCQTVDEEIYERIFYGPALDAAVAECRKGTAQAQNRQTPAFDEVLMAPAAEVAPSAPDDQADPPVGIQPAAILPAPDLPSTEMRQRDCMSELGWKQIPAYNASAQRAQPYAVGGPARRGTSS